MKGMYRKVNKKAPNIDMRKGLAEVC